MSLIQGLRRLRAEVLGMNRRNIDLLQRYNRGPLYAIVDHKQETKVALAARGLPVPETYAVCASPSRLGLLADEMMRRSEFVLKPARGAGGEGIVVIAARDGEIFRTASGRRIKRSHIVAHAADILAGAYALSQARDEALLEYRLRGAPELAPFSPGGVPDVRVIVFRGVPIMAMLRLPTTASDGRANLHAGGIGVGIGIASGRTGAAVCQGRPIFAHPDSGATLGGWTVPHWERMRRMAAEAYEAVPLGYFGVDIVLDAARGPVILEMNARPGLAIQLATQRGLRVVVDRVAALQKIEERPAEERDRVGVEISAPLE